MSGRVLEIGVGTGLNLTLYEAAERVIALDFDRLMLRKAPARAARAPVQTNLMLADAQELPFAGESFDTVVSSLVFCTVPDPLRGMTEVKRVLKPGGRFLLVEHVRSALPVLARIQDRLNPAWTRFASGCNLNRQTFRTVQAAGFAVKSVTFEFWRHVLVIDASAPGLPVTPS